MTRLGKKHPLVSSVPKSYSCGNCRPYIPPSKSDCDLLPQDTQYQLCSPYPHFAGLYNSNTRASPFSVDPLCTIRQNSTNNSGSCKPNDFTSFFTSDSSPIIDASGNVYYTTYFDALTDPSIIILNKVKPDGTTSGISFNCNSSEENQPLIGLDNNIYLFISETTFRLATHFGIY